MLLLQLSGDFIDKIQNIYQLIAFVIFALCSIAILIIEKRYDKKKTDKIISNFDEQNKNILNKIDQIREHKNILDDESSMNIISLLLNKSCENVQYAINDIIDNILFNDQRMLYMTKKSIIHEKIKDIIYTNFDRDKIMLNKIYHNNIKLSYFISEYNRDDLIREINDFLLSIKSQNDKTDVNKFIQNKYLNIIQSIQLKITR